MQESITNKADIIVEEGFYEIPWIMDIAKDICAPCELIGFHLFCYYPSEEAAYDAVSKCCKRHILLSHPIIYNNKIQAYRITIICQPTQSIFELMPYGDKSGEKPILD